MWCKLDRQALIALGDNPLQTHYQAPQTDLQREVASLWQEVLEVERVGLASSSWAVTRCWRPWW